jgi:hypothetical protein
VIETTLYFIGDKAEQACRRGDAPENKFGGLVPRLT